MEGEKAVKEEYEPGLFEFGIFTAASVGMITVGFQLGRSRQIEEFLDSTGSFPKRFNNGKINSLNPNLNKFHAGEIAAQAQSVDKSTRLAMRALGYGTLLCISSATLMSLGVAYAFDIKNFQEFSNKLKRNVPIHSATLQSHINPGLKSFRIYFEGVFAGMKPYLFRKRNDYIEKIDPAEIQKEKELLQRAGFDPSILDNYSQPGKRF